MSVELSRSVEHILDSGQQMPIILLEIYLDSATLRFNTTKSNYVFPDAGNTYYAKYMAFGDLVYGIEGELMSIEISLDNVLGDMSGYINSEDFYGKTVIIRRVFGDRKHDYLLEEDGENLLKEDGFFFELEQYRYNDSTDGIVLFEGKVKEILEMTNKIVKFKNVAGKGIDEKILQYKYQKSCNLTFGDSKCNYNGNADLTQLCVLNGVVESGSTNYFIDSSISVSSNTYKSINNVNVASTIGITTRTRNNYAFVLSQRNGISAYVISDNELIWYSNHNRSTTYYFNGAPQQNIIWEGFDFCIYEETTNEYHIFVVYDGGLISYKSLNGILTEIEVHTDIIATGSAYLTISGTNILCTTGSGNIKTHSFTTGGVITHLNTYALSNVKYVNSIQYSTKNYFIITYSVASTTIARLYTCNSSGVMTYTGNTFISSSSEIVTDVWSVELSGTIYVFFSVGANGVRSYSINTSTDAITSIDSWSPDITNSYGALSVNGFLDGSTMNILLTYTNIGMVKFTSTDGYFNYLSNSYTPPSEFIYSLDYNNTNDFITLTSGYNLFLYKIRDTNFDDYFKYGMVELWEDGVGIIKRSICTYHKGSTGKIMISSTYPDNIDSGYRYNIYKGCSKDIDACKSIYNYGPSSNNIDNFYGFIHVKEVDII